MFEIIKGDTHSQTDINKSLINHMNHITSDYESGESSTNSDYNSDTDKLQLIVSFLFFEIN